MESAETKICNMMQILPLKECSQAVSDIAVHGDQDQYVETHRVGHDWRQQTESWCPCSVVKMNVKSTRTS